MKKNRFALATALALCLGLMPVRAQKTAVPINENTFPDNSFRAVAEALPGAEDGVFTPSELCEIKELRCGGQDILSLEGLVYFPALEKLDVSGCPVEEVDVHVLPNLKTLICNDSKFRTLDVSGHPTLEEIFCDRGRLEELDAGDCPSLKRIHTWQTSLYRVNVRGCPELKELCGGRDLISEVDVSQNPKLEVLSFAESYLHEVDVSANPELKFLDLSSNMLKVLDMSGNRKLENVTVGEGLTVYVPAEGLRLSLLADHRELKSMEGGSVDRNGWFHFDPGVDTASLEYLAEDDKPLILKKLDAPVQAAYTTPEGVRVETARYRPGKVLADIHLPEGVKRVTVFLPDPTVTPATAACIREGNRPDWVLPACVPVEGGMELSVTEDVKLVLKERKKPFYDIIYEQEAWYCPYVEFVGARDLFMGVEPWQFGPHIPMTRGMIPVVLRRLMADGTETPAEVPFSDIKPGDWYAGAAAWAAEEGIAAGYPDGRFGPNDPVTREQLALMLYHACGAKPVKNHDLTFIDSAEVSPYAETAVCWAVRNGILRGVGGNRLAPGGEASRAETAAMLMRFIALNL